MFMGQPRLVAEDKMLKAKDTKKQPQSEGRTDNLGAERALLATSFSFQPFQLCLGDFVAGAAGSQPCVREHGAANSFVPGLGACASEAAGFRNDS